MTCLIWRQHRGQLLWSSVVVAALGAAMLAVAHSADLWLADYHHWLAHLRAAGCPLPSETSGRVHAPSAGCRSLISRYRGGEQSSFAMAYNFAILVFEEGVPLVMVIVGALVGAPVVAREVEQRTQLVAWTQSVSRRRWYLTKVGVLATGLVIVGLVAGFANDRLQDPLTRGGLTSSRWPWFFSVGPLPAAEAVLAFALAVAIGARLRRTVPAVGGALVGFLFLFLVTGWAVRGLTPLSHVRGDRGAPGDSWMIGSGHYHPAVQYWPLQLTDVALLLLLSAALLGVGWRATRAQAV